MDVKVFGGIIRFWSGHVIVLKNSAFNNKSDSRWLQSFEDDDKSWINIFDIASAFILFRGIEKYYRQNSDKNMFCIFILKVYIFVMIPHGSSFIHKGYILGFYSIFI